jgi:hypothetical protein
MQMQMQMQWALQQHATLMRLQHEWAMQAREAAHTANLLEASIRQMHIAQAAQAASARRALAARHAMR